MEEERSRRQELGRKRDIQEEGRRATHSSAREEILALRPRRRKGTCGNFATFSNAIALSRDTRCTYVRTHSRQEYRLAFSLVPPPYFPLIHAYTYPYIRCQLGLRPLPWNAFVGCRVGVIVLHGARQLSRCLRARTARNPGQT